MGEGTIIVNIGLLRSIHNQYELAFILAHEIAHYEENHVRLRLVKLLDGILSKKAQNEIKSISQGDGLSLEALELLQNWAYEGGRFSRDVEIEADRLGLDYYRNAGYPDSQTIETLNMLDSAEYSIAVQGAKLLEPLHNSKYPFKQHWLKPRLSICSKRSSQALIFRSDSISTHPEFQQRIANLISVIDTASSTGEKVEMEPLIPWVHIVAEFETVEGAFKTRRFDRSMYHALKLIPTYPQNSYLVTMISKVFVTLIQADKDNLFQYYLTQYTASYGEDLRMVNNLLHNLRTNEMGELAYHFLNNQSNFNPQIPEHYYLLWQLGKFTDRKDLQVKVKDAYRSKFPDGEHYNKMK